MTSPVRGLEVETDSRQAKWDATKGVFYETEEFMFNQDMKQEIITLNLRDDEKFNDYFKIGTEGEFSYDRLAFYVIITNCHYNFGIKMN